MKKALRITAVVAAAMQLFYWIIGRIVGPIVLAPLFYGGGGMFLRTSDSDLVGYIVFQLIMGGFVFLVYLLFSILMIYQAGGKSEKIGVEIAGYVILCIVIPIINTVAGTVMSIVMSRMRSAVYLGLVSSLNTVTGYLSFLNGFAYVAIIISITLSVSNKKFVIPLEYELGRGIETEETQLYGTMSNDSYYTGNNSMNGTMNNTNQYGTENPQYYGNTNGGQ